LTSVPRLLQELNKSQSRDVWESICDQLATYSQIRIIDAIQSLTEVRRQSPAASYVLQCLCYRRGIQLLDVFTEEEILTDCLTYIDASIADDTDSKRDSQWAWEALVYAPMADADRWRLTIQLIGQAPGDDDTLLQLGDGPVAALQMQRGGSDRLSALAQTDPRVERILELLLHEFD
jgi:hypothetical protein